MQGEEENRSTPLWSKASRSNGRLWGEQFARRRHDRSVVCGRCALRLLDNEHYLFLLPQTDPRTLQPLPLYFFEEMDRFLTCARDGWPIQASQRPPRVQDKVTYTLDPRTAFDVTVTVGAALHPDCDWLRSLSKGSEES